jgi:hypothetical protein
MLRSKLIASIRNEDRAKESIGVVAHFEWTKRLSKHNLEIRGGL